MKLQTLRFISLFLIVPVLAVAQTQTDPALLAASRKALPKDVATEDIVKALNGGLWNANRTAISISINRVPKPSLIFVFLKNSAGHYTAGDISGVEDRNIGVWGICPRSCYDRFETTPIKWLSRDDGRFQVEMRTTAWKGNQRYEMNEPLVIDPDGTPLGR